MLQTIILAGGAGARLAPLSSPACPKPFVPFQRGLSLYARTLMRVATLTPPIVIGHYAHRHALHNHATDAGVKLGQVLLEDAPHNTALAVAIAVAQASPDNMLLILPADHWIDDAHAWCTGIDALASALRPGMLGLMGVVPNRPHSGYGYVHTRGEKAPFAVEAFLEKPAHHEDFQQPGWFWNAGMVVATQRTLQQVFITHAPEIWQAATTMLARTATHADGLVLLPAPASLPAISFDVAVLERMATQCVLQPMPCDWADLGTPEDWCDISGEDWNELCARPTRIDRPWGYFYAHETRPHCVRKTLHVYPGRRLSMQRHQQRTEHWHVLTGTATVTLEDITAKYSPGQDVQVQAGMWHRLANDETTMLVIEETQTGAPDESDIERREDDFGRA